MQENNEQSLNKKNTKKKRRHPEIKISWQNILTKSEGLVPVEEMTLKVYIAADLARVNTLASADRDVRRKALELKWQLLLTHTYNVT